MTEVVSVLNSMVYSAAVFWYCAVGLLFIKIGLLMPGEEEL
jgi:hypothetical protein